MKEFNKIISGNALEVLKEVPSGIIDLAVTDPPYGVRYRDRTGRSVKNDDDLSAVLPVFGELYRAMRPNSYCISFYGWNRVDEFMKAWKDAGFTVAGHIVWTKDYSSRTGVLKYHHEQAYVLAKGRPARPAAPIADVQHWTRTGNRAHPTEKAVESLQPLIKAFSKRGDLVCDPFSGSGSTSVAAALSGRQYLGIELEEKYCAHARQRLAGVNRYLQTRPDALAA
ncbi:DNA methylase [Palleronia sediminis]|uniref:Methyltransferase n=1 Tax=Palleronia sediminis TaxID=2547833 RepID=A0A4R5ZVC2_9RHOB|nr:DNA methyltransferase [Palleronia sediminis]TDL74115.1 DNA methylase [Palleronia sediminis]